MYTYSGLAAWRSDLFLVLGLWHTYPNLRVPIWREFRSSFLGQAYFALFPGRNLFFKPRLIQSVTCFTWIRLAYSRFRDLLVSSLKYLKALSEFADLIQLHLLREKEIAYENSFRLRYIRLFNLYSLLENIIPSAADYGASLKSNDWPLFRSAFLRVIDFFLSCKLPGSGLYQTSLFFFYGTLCYWERSGLPIATLLNRAHTMFSEESGEVALSVLSSTIPSQSRTDFNSAQQAWRLCKLNYQQLRHEIKDGRLPKIALSLSVVPASLFRIVFHFFHLCSFHVMCRWSFTLL